MFSGALDEEIYRAAFQGLEDLSPADATALLQSGRLEKAFDKALRKTLPGQAKALVATLNARAPAMLRARRKVLRGFERRLHRTWQKPLDRLEQLLVIAAETGQLVSAAWPWSESRDADIVFEVLRRLHARACQVGEEVLALLKAGFASGAHARWRALHETAVTAHFIVKHGKDTAERYLLHEHVEAYDARRLYQEHAKTLKQRPYGKAELAKMDSTYATLAAQYGKAFTSQYGWAAAALGKKDGHFGFRQIEKDVGLDHWRPHYKLASHPVHANPKSITFSLALGPRQKLLLTGPSNLGLSDPGHSAAISILQVSSALLALRRSIEASLVGLVMGLLVDEIGKAFLTAHKAVLKKGDPSRHHRARDAAARYRRRA